MATKNDSLADTTEYCDACDRQTAHRVRVELVTESSTPKNSEFSREPYRSTECQVCGASNSIRMNNA